MRRNRKAEGGGLRRALRRRLVAGALALFRIFVLAVPRSWDPALARFLYATLRLFAARIASRMLDHLRLVYGDTMTAAERLALMDRAAFAYCRGVIEFIRMDQLDPADVRRRTRVRGQGVLRRAFASGRGVILLTAHYGNFEMMAANCGAYGLPITVIARSRTDELVEQWLAATRARHGLTIVHKQGWRAALRVLKSGGTLGVIADQAVRTGGVMADFLGHPSPTAVGPILLARSTGAIVIPAFITRDANDRFTVEIHEPLEFPNTGDEEADLQAAAQMINDVISRQIHHKPDEWLWMHRRWKQPISLRSGPVRLDRALNVDDPEDTPD